MALFATCQPELLKTSTLPSEIKSLFRQVSFLRPDLLVMLKAKCLALQFKAPSLLALRLKIVADLMKDQVYVSKFSVLHLEIDDNNSFQFKHLMCYATVLFCYHVQARPDQFQRISADVSIAASRSAEANGA